MPVRTFGHADDDTRDEAAMVGYEARGDERVGRFDDHVLHPTERAAELRVGGAVAPVEQAEGCPVRDEHPEARTEAVLNLLALSRRRGGRADPAKSRRATSKS